MSVFSSHLLILRHIRIYKTYPGEEGIIMTGLTIPPGLCLCKPASPNHSVRTASHSSLSITFLMLHYYLWDKFQPSFHVHSVAYALPSIFVQSIIYLYVYISLFYFNLQAFASAGPSVWDIYHLFPFVTNSTQVRICDGMFTLTTMSNQGQEQQEKHTIFYLFSLILSKFSFESN